MNTLFSNRDRFSRTAMVRYSACVPGLIVCLFSMAAHSFTTTTWPLPAEINDQGFDVTSSVNDRSIGATLNAAGDFNGDGIGDILIGAPAGDSVHNQSGSGSAYVLFGTRSAGNRAPIDLEGITPDTGMVVTSSLLSDGNFGASAASAGDLNNDGIDDIVIASPGTGTVAVIFGSRNPDAVLDIGDIDGSNGFLLSGESGGDLTGHVVGSAGDMNRDGVDDLLVTAPFADVAGVTNSGRVYVIFGRRSYPSLIELESITSEVGLVMDSARVNAEVGYSASGIGDFNADGFSDVAIGAFGLDDDPELNRNGQVYVVYGGPQLPANIDLTALNGSNGFTVDRLSTTNPHHGVVERAGDINGDGYDDIAIAYQNNDERFFSTENEILFGHRRTDATWQLPFETDRISSMRFYLGQLDESLEPRKSQSWLKGIGDLDADGYDDLIVAGDNARLPGKTTNVYFGDRRFRRAPLDQFTHPSLGFTVRPRPGDGGVGKPGNYIGDVNGDGFADFAVISPSANVTGVGNGRVQIVFGRKATKTPREDGYLYPPGPISVTYEPGGINPTRPEDFNPNAGQSGVASLPAGFMRGLVAEYVFENNLRDNSRWKHHLSRRGSSTYQTVQQRRGITMRHRDSSGLVRRTTSRLAVPGHLSVAFSAKLGSNAQYSPVVGHFTSSRVSRYFLPSFSVQLLPRGAVQLVIKRPQDQLFWVCTTRPGLVNHGRVNHFVVTRNRSSGRVNFYMNGRIAQSCAAPAGVLATNGRQIAIGTYREGAIDDATTDLFVDNMQIYSRLLSATEVRMLSQSEVPTRQRAVDTPVVEVPESNAIPMTLESLRAFGK